MVTTASTADGSLTTGDQKPSIAARKKVYRAERRNDFMADRRTVAPVHRKAFRWKGTAAVKEASTPPVSSNKRDRSPQAEQRRKDRSVTMDFTDGVNGISRALINHSLQTIQKKKPKRGWAAKRRATPWKDTTTDKERGRHAWFRKATTSAPGSPVGREPSKQRELSQ
jgi:hypothetical protein